MLCFLEIQLFSNVINGNLPLVCHNWNLNAYKAKLNFFEKKSTQSVAFFKNVLTLVPERIVRLVCQAHDMIIRLYFIRSKI